jgi:hypothetical protein
MQPTELLWVPGLAGKTALEDIQPLLCPGALRHPTTLRIMERLQADGFAYDINRCAPLLLCIAKVLTHMHA